MIFAEFFGAYEPDQKMPKTRPNLAKKMSMLFLFHISTLVFSHRPSFPLFPLYSLKWGFWVSRVCLWVYILIFCVRSAQKESPDGHFKKAKTDQYLSLICYILQHTSRLIDAQVSLVLSHTPINWFWALIGIGTSISLSSMPKLPPRTAIKSPTPSSG